MNSRTRRVITTAAATTAGLAGVLFAGAGPAAAASASQAAAICGSGYTPLGSYGVGPASSPVSIIYVSYNAGTDCVVDIKVADVGTPTEMYTYLNGPNASWGGNADDGSEDVGSYSYYAGPVYTYAPGACIYWGGGFNATFTDDYGPGYCN
ncbi:hypothetical protein KDK95_05395 [Actinospica sp. MGRD01-02]|uniref:Spore-associated protein A n=1 Tax=Actinospica acidithermotolerans TaxID=2828514 RepID=A0A941II21_9ACTN|nr:hypothetical protein [Actinospica acidithermotolerans]MBR7825733.1 hypothetical protein [Actinospica acidithermotolerans]